MKDILDALDEVVDAFERTHPFGSTKEKRKQSFAPIASKIRNFSFLANQKAPFIKENIGRIEWHYGTVFRIEPTNGHSVVRSEALKINSAALKISQALWNDSDSLISFNCPFRGQTIDPGF